MERNQDLTAAYVTVKVNGGTNVLRNIFHFNSEAIEEAFRNEFNDTARLTDFLAVSAAQERRSSICTAHEPLQRSCCLRLREMDYHGYN